jgi:type II secretory pathway pseudopilin PulG
MSRARRDAGFTLIGLSIALMIVSLLVRLAIPAYGSLKRDAIAAAASRDLNTVRAAAIAQYDATGAYAPDAPAGVVPAGMARYLPRGFSFRRHDYELDWENLAIADSASPDLTAGTALALTVIANDAGTGRQMLQTLGANRTHWSAGDAHTFVILSTLEAPRRSGTSNLPQ